jgi:ATP-dependent Zn protease
LCIKKAKSGEDVDNFKDIIGYGDIKIELDRYYAQVKRMIAENITLLDKITDALVKDKTITGADIRELKSAC